MKVKNTGEIKSAHDGQYLISIVYAISGGELVIDPPVKEINNQTRNAVHNPSVN